MSGIHKITVVHPSALHPAIASQPQYCLIVGAVGVPGLFDDGEGEACVVESIFCVVY